MNARPVSSVYMAQSSSDGPVKIGLAADVNRRLYTLQCGSAHELRAIRILEGDDAVEAWLHKRFAAHRIEREWFHFCPEMLTVQPPPLMPRRPAKVQRDAIFDVPKALRLAFPTQTPKHVAAILGCSHRTVEDWLQSRSAPSAESLFRLAAVNEIVHASLTDALAVASARSLTGRAA